MITTQISTLEITRYMATCRERPVRLADSTARIAAEPMKLP